jgi:hypothetical protein
VTTIISLDKVSHRLHTGFSVLKGSCPGYWNH